MAHITADRVLQVVTPVSTTSFTLGTAITGFRGIAAIPGVANNDTVFYAAWAVDANGTPTGEWENGLGTYVSAGGSLTRTTIISSSNSNNAVTFTGSPVWLSVTLLASKTAYFDKDHAMFVPTATAEPPTPVGGIELYAREIVPGNTVLKNMRPSGADSPIQDGIAFNRFVKYAGGNSTITAIGGGGLTTTGSSLSNVNAAAGTNIRNGIPRTQFATATTANSVANFVSAGQTGGFPVLRGSITGEGGFRLVIRFGLSAIQSGARFFAGLRDSTSAATAVDPFTSATTGVIGVALNQTTSANFRIIHAVSGTAPTNIDLGANFPANTTDLIELILFCRPNNGTAGDIGYRVRRYTTTGAPAFEQSGTLSTNLPAAATLLYGGMWMATGGATGVSSFQVISMTVESDF